MKTAVIMTICVCVLFVGYLLVRKPRTADKSIATYHGPVSEYRGGKKLIVVFTASWASFWKLTAEELSKLDKQRFDLAILDQATDEAEIRKFSITFLPTVALVEEGRITRKVQNLSDIAQIRDW